MPAGAPGIAERAGAARRLGLKADEGGVIPPPPPDTIVSRFADELPKRAAVAAVAFVATGDDNDVNDKGEEEETGPEGEEAWGEGTPDGEAEEGTCVPSPCSDRKGEPAGARLVLPEPAR